ncbi:hypothetical protein [Fimbriiglobus ruber]|uniref:Uncharacterized protein n=1 Tax=Fimbriiglobus ruber TaxID=1908690 RepID=A0A225D549_9BACT|nr:hypothetical protein [Fimbriiglobus ruber]OWK36612.1 hypothetical protein FRUB_09175 [Fimbriiglobus ruber]
MSNVILTLPPDTEKKLRAKAGSAGLPLEIYLVRLAELDAANEPLPPKATFEEVVAPVRAAFQDSEMTDDDITDLVQEAREEVWQEKQSRKPA